MKEAADTKFLGLQIDNHLNWKTHICQLVSKPSGPCYAVRSMLKISNIDTPKSIYSAYFHFLMAYGIIFWGNSSDSKKTFSLQKKTVKTHDGC
jgi:hypothetical protein